jgi:hypothetical protein
MKPMQIRSFLGERLSEQRSLPFIEWNREIEEISGMPAIEVMALYGQEGYRRQERQALERVVATTDSGVLAVVGGIVARTRNVCLFAEPLSYDLVKGALRRTHETYTQSKRFASGEWLSKSDRRVPFHPYQQRRVLFKGRGHGRHKWPLRRRKLA